MAETIKLTYFTPTYNRARLLPVLFASLSRQTNKNFVWMIVDDGSTDDTENLVKEFAKQSDFKIVYYKKENGGKHTCMDFSNQKCETEFITCVDSDDYLTDDATEVILRNLDKCAAEDIVGIVSVRAQQNAPKEYEGALPDYPIYFYDINKYYNQVPETMLIFKTKIAKEYHFPEVKQERFITESVYYKQFFYKYKFAPIHEKIYVAEYVGDGYTMQGLRLFVKNPIGYALALKQNAAIQIGMAGRFMDKLRLVCRYYGWKAYFKIKGDVYPEYKIGFPYNFLGKLFTPVYKGKIKKEVAVAQNAGGKNN